MRNILITLLFLCSCVSGPSIPSAQAQKVAIYIFANDQQEKDTITTIDHQTSDRPFSLVEIEYWSKFERLIKAGSTGVYYAPPHFASWLTNKHHFKPLLSLDEPLSYYVIAQQLSTHIFELSDLARLKVCVRPPLSMDFLYYRSQFQDTVSAPLMESISNIEKTIRTKPSFCDAYVVNNHQAERLFATNPDQFVKLSRSAPFANYQFVAHPNIKAETLVSIKQWLIENQTALSPILKRNSTLAELKPSNQNDDTNDLLKELTQYWQEPSAK